jgi:putative flippase GtrA
MDMRREMREKVHAIINKYGSETILYVIVGGLTTLVNYAAFTIFINVFGVDLASSSIIGIGISILFAYVMNKRFVFRSKCRTRAELGLEFLKFTGSRVLTSLIEHYGLLFLVFKLGQHQQVAKIEAIVVVIILNYIISKFIVFSKTKK